MTGSMNEVFCPSLLVECGIVHDDHSPKFHGRDEKPFCPSIENMLSGDPIGILRHTFTIGDSAQYPAKLQN
jgi:hypothetical protein